MADIPDIEFITFDKSSGMRAYVDIRARLSGRRFDYALCMHASMRANLIALLINSPQRVGFDFARARDLQWLITNRRIEARQAEHALEAMLGFATYIDVPVRDLRWDIPLSDAQREFAAGLRAPDRPLLVISPCSSQRTRNFRNWSAENYAAVANHAQRRFACRIVLTGGGRDIEAEYGRTIEALCSGDVVNLIGRTSLKQLLAIIDESDALVCPDSGPAHMATSVGAPVIGLYATSNPARTGPYLSRDLTVDMYPEAAKKYLGKPPGQLRWGQRVRHPDAMSLIRVAQVNERIDRVFTK